MRKTRALMLTAAVSSGLLALAACSKSEPESPPIENIETPALEEMPTMNEPAPMPTETAAPVNTADALPPPAPVEPDQQMLDDAAAVGMTARADRSQPSEEAPVENAQQ
ncbi:conserved exported hypothetical protein [Sphingomonas sp. EC-HK361]|uniref:hypothetical protein n=1 Tax=Sphingomonas sp. EC-HK361 TaxID=2038397 RepID=UPI00125869D8|nr:hypothetical protein [Sphingomonas sp. EC-HK361]VVT08499.1 conserved exported hypothetical protein [Sphingomonas sp. EC-HK361]